MQPRHVVPAWVEAFNRADADALAAFYTEGAINHQIFIDEDAPGHIIALAKWRSRADADAVRNKYKDSETIRQLTPLLVRPRDRWVTHEDQAADA